MPEVTVNRLRDVVLLGPLSLDRYVNDARPDVVLPGGGVLNTAVHWSVEGIPSTVLSRVGDDSSAFLEMLFRHDIDSSSALVRSGPSCSVHVAIGPDRQPSMNGFDEGVWRGLRLSPDEDTIVAAAKHLHVVLVTGSVDEIVRLHAEGRLGEVTVSGDFLSFRRYSVERFASIIEHLDIAFVGWPGASDDPTIEAISSVVFLLRKLAVITMGARQVVAFDGRDGAAVIRVYAVDSVPVAGTTAGCGDAFIASFLSTWWATSDLGASVAAGMRHGALATAWQWALPDAAYER